MSDTRFDVIVAGVGAMGAAACFHLTRRGARVLGLERFGIPHELGSSGGHTRLIRLAYFEHPDYVPLLRHAYGNWHELESRVGRKVLHQTGAVYIGPPEGHLVAGSLQAAVAHGIEHEMLSPAAVAERCGPFELPEGFAAFYEPAAGFLLAGEAIASHAELALAGGAKLHAFEAIQSWRANADGVEVTTDHDTYSADRLVITAGAWSQELHGEIDVELTVTRQAVVWLWPNEPDRFRLGRFTCWGIEDDTPGFRGIYYGFPMVPGQPGLKMAHHAPGEEATPAHLDRSVRRGDAESIETVVDKFIPLAKGPLVNVKICMYTMSPDEHFVIDAHPEHANVILACGFSGHGFKFASAIGEALADLTLDGRSELPIAFMSLERFSSSRSAG
jgi:sarcosine oxidase